MESILEYQDIDHVTEVSLKAKHDTVIAEECNAQCYAKTFLINEKVTRSLARI